MNSSCEEFISKPEACLWILMSISPRGSFQSRARADSSAQMMISLSEIMGGGERDRTDDLLLAKQALSQLSYTPDKTWWVWLDLNQRPHAYQACALTS